MNEQFLWENQLGEREWLFFECKDVKAFNRAMRDMGGFFQLPLSGGLREERAVVELPSGTKLFGVSYRGSIEKWRGGLVAFCKATNRQFALGRVDCVELADGTRIDLPDIKLTNY